MFEVLNFVFNGLLIFAGVALGLLLLYAIICIIVLGAKELKKEVAEDEPTE